MDIDKNMCDNDLLYTCNRGPWLQQQPLPRPAGRHQPDLVLSYHISSSDSSVNPPNDPVQLLVGMAYTVWSLMKKEIETTEIWLIYLDYSNTYNYFYLANQLIQKNFILILHISYQDLTHREELQHKYMYHNVHIIQIYTNQPYI